MLSLGQLRTRGRNNAVEPSKKYISDACIIPQEAKDTHPVTKPSDRCGMPEESVKGGEDKGFCAQMFAFLD